MRVAQRTQNEWTRSQRITQLYDAWYSDNPSTLQTQAALFSFFTVVPFGWHRHHQSLVDSPRNRPVVEERRISRLPIRSTVNKMTQYRRGGADMVAGIFHWDVQVTTHECEVQRAWQSRCWACRITLITVDVCKATELVNTRTERASFSTSLIVNGSETQILAQQNDCQGCLNTGLLTQSLSVANK